MLGPVRPGVVVNGLIAHNAPTVGISSHSSPSSSRPLALGVRPPHCLKKNGTAATTQASRIPLAHSSCMGRLSGPDSPPAMTQSIPDRLIPLSEPSRGSQDRNLTAAGTWPRWLTRVKAAAFSTDTPIHRLGGHDS